MAQLYALPDGFSTTPPAASGAARPVPFTLPQGFSLTPPKAATAPASSAMDQINNAVRGVPLFGQIFNAATTAADALNQGGTPGPGERRGELAPVIRNEQTGALRLAWPQLAVDAASAFNLPGDVASSATPLDPRLSYSQQDPATLDRAANLATMVGAGTPLAGAGAAQGNAVVMADGRAIPRLIAGDLSRSNIAPSQVNSSIAALGPAGVLADISPVLQGRAAKLATLPERAQTIIADTLASRQANAGPRINAALNGIAGPEPVPSAVTAGIEARKDALGPIYERLVNGSNAQIDTQPIVANLNGNAAILRGPAQKALASVRRMFDLPPAIAGENGPAITRDPRTVFEIRNAIDGMISTEKNPKVIGALTAVRQRIDKALGAAIPGLKTLDSYYQEQARQQEGFDLGRTALRHGEAPLHPDDLATAMQQTAMQSTAGPMPRPSQYPDMIRQGLVSKMYEIVGNNTNDRISLKKIITGEGKWNYQKIAAALGTDKAQRLLNLFQNEATMANTENLALAGSKTARMASGGQGMEANPNAGGFLKNALNMDFGDAALGLGSKLTGGAFDARRAARNATIADILMSHGGFQAAPGLPIVPPQLAVPYTAQIYDRNRPDLARLLRMGGL